MAVLFCDIVGFTRYCDQHPPERVVAELQNLVAFFEDLVAQPGMEKIKTIGDAFMATAGLLNHCDAPVLTSVKCGLEMCARSVELDLNWKVRVSVHFGPVVAGIMGKRQFLFDLWGDTVTTAARIVGRASPGSVALSGAARIHVRNRCRGKSLGMVELKGKAASKWLNATRCVRTASLPFPALSVVEAPAQSRVRRTIVEIGCCQIPGGPAIKPE